MRFLIQLILCAVVLAAGVAGFIALKAGKDPVETTPSAAQTEKTTDTGNVDAKAGDVEGEKKPDDAAPARPWPVAVVTVAKSSNSPTLKLYGTVETPRETRLTAAVNADVNLVTVLEGQQVTKGDVLIELDATDIELVLAQRKAERAELTANAAAQDRRHAANIASLESEREILELGRRQLDRYTKLASRQIGTRAAADDAARVVKQQELAITNRQNAIDDFDTTMAGIMARIARADAQIKQANRDLARTRIIAPFSGRLTNVAVSPGDRVRPGEPLVTLYDTAFVEVRTQVPNRTVPLIQRALANGEQLIARGEFAGTTLNLRLDRLAAVARSGSGGVDALLRVVDATTPQLGRTVNVVLNLPGINDSFVVPTSAINDAGNVYVVRDGTLKTVTINKAGEWRGPDGKTGLLLTSDEARDGDQIVISPVPLARDGMAVEIRQ